VKIAILDDGFDTLRGLAGCSRLAGHDVTVFLDHTAVDVYKRDYLW
jgi:hypothetical protein